MRSPLFFSLALTAATAFGGVVEFADDGVEIKTRDATYTVETIDGQEVIKARLEPTEKWSFVRFEPSAGSWDLSKYSGIDVQITNAGSATVKPGVRVDEVDGISREAWNSAASKDLPPGDTKTFRVQFGMDYHKPKALNLSAIGAVQIFLGKSREEATTLIISKISAVE
jgi:hypothetical protein